MKPTAALLAILLLMCQSALAQLNAGDPLAHTFSIVARDKRTGEMAVAVQSHWFSVGTAVSWGQAGVGVVATQSFVNKSFGLRGLALLEDGLSPDQALQQMLFDDEARDYRQVAVLNSDGEVATHTGRLCIDFAGHLNGPDFSVQANMMLTDNVVPAMKQAWLTHEGEPLAERVLSVLAAAQAAGGDIRGKQSAALLVVAGKATDSPWNDRLIDLRVDDSDNPIKELARLLQVHRAYDYMNEGDLQVEKGKMDLAMEAYRKAMTLFPGNLEMKYWTAITLANNKQTDEALALLQGVYKKDPNWKALTQRLRKVGLLTVDDKDFERLTR